MILQRLHHLLLCHYFFLTCLAFLCPPGQRKVYREEKCEPCQAGQYQPASSRREFCSLCNVCHEDSGSEYEQKCTLKSAAKCRCRVGFTPKNGNKDNCMCTEGSGLVKTASGIECRECDKGYFTNKADTYCMKWKDCSKWGVRINGSKTSDAVCNNDPEEPQAASDSTPTILSYSHNKALTAQTSGLAPTSTLTTIPTTRPAVTIANDERNYSPGLVFYILSLILLVLLSAVSCRLVIIPCTKNYLKRVKKTDAGCRKPVEECGDQSQSSLVKSSQGLV